MSFFHAFRNSAAAQILATSDGLITLGQAINTLSAAKPSASVAFDSARIRGTTLYGADEPTTGFHFLTWKLIYILHRGGHGQHRGHHRAQLDIVKDADYIIDLGPEGGEQGGRLVACGTPAEIVEDSKQSFTARFLREYLNGGAKAVARKPAQEAITV